MRRDELLNWMPSIEAEFDRRGLDTYAMAVSKATEIIRRDGETIAALEAERDELLATPADKREDLRCVIADISAQCAELWAERDQLRVELAECKNALASCIEALTWEAGGEPLPDMSIRARSIAINALREGGE